MTTDHTEFITALEGAEGPNKELDQQIALAFGWIRFPRTSISPGGWIKTDHERHELVVHPSADLNLAIQNVPKDMYVDLLSEDCRSGQWHVALTYRSTSHIPLPHHFKAIAATAALALWAAIFMEQMLNDERKI